MFSNLDAATTTMIWEISVLIVMVVIAAFSFAGEAKEAKAKKAAEAAGKSAPEGTAETVPVDKAAKPEDTVKEASSDAADSKSDQT